MTEMQWNASTEPWEMLHLVHYKGVGSKRKLRLFGTACCRRVWHLLTDRRSRAAVDVVERHSDGPRASEEWGVALIAAQEVAQVPEEDAHSTDRAKLAAFFAATAAAKAMGRLTELDLVALYAGKAWSLSAAVGHQGDSPPGSPDPAYAAEREVQSHLLRDIIGNPFRPQMPLSPCLLAWSDGLIIKLAEAAYEHRSLPLGHLDPDRLAVLADALTDAGCTDDRILGHLRSPGPHVRGCFAVDALMGKS